MSDNQNIDHVIISIKDNPIELYKKWAGEAKMDRQIKEPTAVALATSSKSGVPSVRMVLIKQADENGFVFYTNLESRKSLDLFENPVASFCQHWMPMEKQIRVDGNVEQLDDQQADQYFNTRDTLSRIGAWASRQSRVMEDKFELEKRVAKYTAEFALKKIVRPDHWSGFRIVPYRIEFWQAKAFRLHDRIEFIKTDQIWKGQYLFP